MSLVQCSHRFSWNEHAYSNAIPGYHYNPKTDKIDWDTNGKAKKIRADINKNIYKDIYDQDYWKTYDQAENQVETEQKTLTANEIRMYHEKHEQKKLIKVFKWRENDA